MVTTKHTPGPWQFVEQDRGRKFRVYINIHGSGGGEDIAQNIEFMNNARLIAATPDLLKAINRLLGDVPRKFPWGSNNRSGPMAGEDIAAAFAAIDKANKGPIGK